MSNHTDNILCMDGFYAVPDFVLDRKNRELANLEAKVADQQRRIDALEKAAQEKIDADIDCWAAQNLHQHVIANARNEKAHDTLAALLATDDSREDGKE